MNYNQESRIKEHVLFVAFQHAEKHPELEKYMKDWRSKWAVHYRLMEVCEIQPILWAEACQNPVDAFTFLEIMESHTMASRMLIKDVYNYYTTQYLKS